MQIDDIFLIHSNSTIYMFLNIAWDCSIDCGPTQRCHTNYHAQRETGVASRCFSMLSTLEDLDNLTSTDGYKHSGKGDLETSPKDGCSLCATMHNEMNFNTSSQARETLRLFLQKGKVKLG